MTDTETTTATATQDTADGTGSTATDTAVPAAVPETNAASPAARTRRIFLYGTQRLSDPNPALKPNEVKIHFAASYPELTSASITLEKTEDVKGVQTEYWQLKKSVGTKG